MFVVGVVKEPLFVDMLQVIVAVACVELATATSGPRDWLKGTCAAASGWLFCPRQLCRGMSMDRVPQMAQQQELLVDTLCAMNIENPLMGCIHRSVVDGYCCHRQQTLRRRVLLAGHAWEV